MTKFNSGWYLCDGIEADGSHAVQWSSQFTFFIYTIDCDVFGDGHERNGHLSEIFFFVHPLVNVATGTNWYETKISQDRATVGAERHF